MGTRLPSPAASARPAIRSAPTPVRSLTSEAGNSSRCSRARPAPLRGPSVPSSRLAFAFPARPSTPASLAARTPAGRGTASIARSTGRYLSSRKCGVPADRLVSAESGQRHLESGLADRLADEVGIEAVHTRALHGLEEPGYVAVVQDGPHPLEAVPVAPRGPGRLRGLVGCPVGRHREAVQIPAKPAADRRESRRINAPGQQQRGRRVGAQVQVGRLGQCRAQVGRPDLNRGRAAGPDGPHLDPAVLPHDSDAVGRDRVDLAERALVRGHRPVAQVPGDRRVVDPRARGEPRQRPYLGCEDEAAVRQLAPVQRLDPERVTDQVEAVRQRVVQGDGEHPAQLGQRVRAELGPQLRDDLAVAGRLQRQPVALRELPEVIDLAVEDAGVPPVGGDERLVARGRRVLDGQPGVPQGDPADPRDHPVVGTAMRLGVVEQAYSRRRPFWDLGR